jgi:hypothetical protein
MRVVVLALLLAGCAGPTIGMASESGGIVDHYGWVPNKALAVAQAHCAKYGRDAVVTSENDLQDHMTFNCVKR